MGCFESKHRPQRVISNHQEFDCNPQGPPQQNNGGPQSGTQRAVNQQLLQLLDDSDDDNFHGANVQILRPSVGQSQTVNMSSGGGGGNQPQMMRMSAGTGQQGSGQPQVVRMSAMPGQQGGSNNGQQMMFRSQPAQGPTPAQEDQGIYGRSDGTDGNQGIYGTGSPQNIYGNSNVYGGGQ